MGIFLRYLATGSFMSVSGELCGISKTTAWRSIHDVMNKLCERRNDFIKFPSNDELEELEKLFRSKRGLPGVLGCVDGTHVPVLVPRNDRSETFRNRKGFMSLNVQMVLWT